MNKTGIFAGLIKKPSSQAGHREEVLEALERWKDTVRYFESVQDPELIDFAIFDMEAAKRRYVFLLKRSAIEE